LMQKYTGNIELPPVFWYKLLLLMSLIAKKIKSTEINAVLSKLRRKI
jgi:hypothetical protein